jgi:hypothetical protein
MPEHEREQRLVTAAWRPDFPAAATSWLTSSSVRYSRLRDTRFGCRRGGTFPFTAFGTLRRRRESLSSDVQRGKTPLVAAASARSWTREGGLSRTDGPRAGLVDPWRRVGGRLGLPGFVMGFGFTGFGSWRI